MRLGNSHGNNTGKRYFIRDRDLPNVKVFHHGMAKEFGNWFTGNHEAIKSQLLTKGCFDEDTVQETYMKLHEIILYTGRKIKCFASYFHRAYYTNHIQEKVQNNRYTELHDNVQYQIDESLDNIEAMKKEEREIKR